MKAELPDRFSEPATDRQRLVITRLCMKRRICEPLEEYPMTLGEAGRLIRELTEGRSESIKYKTALGMASV